MNTEARKSRSIWEADLEEPVWGLVKKRVLVGPTLARVTVALEYRMKRRWGFILGKVSASDS